jgi:hypothetical protein
MGPTGLVRVALKDIHSRDDELTKASALTIESEVPTLSGLPKQLRDALRKSLAPQQGFQFRPWRVEQLAFLASTPMPLLRSLTLREGWFGPEEAAVIARAPWVGQLETLVVEGHPLGDEGLKILLARVSSSLKLLRAAACDLNRSEVLVPSLIELDLDLNELVAFDLHTPVLRRLSTRSNSLGEFAIPDCLGSLVEWDLGENQLTPKMAKKLTGSAILMSLQRLDVSRNLLEREGVAAFALPNAIPSLKQLAIVFNQDGLDEPTVGGDGCLHYPEEWELLYELKRVFAARPGLELVARLSKS